MTETSEPARPKLLRGGRAADHVETRVATQAGIDPRVSMVLAVLAGRPVEDVAQQWDVEPTLLHRWMRDFLVAGSAVVTNHPDPDDARQRDRFLAAFAHELRTPVAVASGWAMMLAEGEVPPSQMATSHARLSEALTRLAEHLYDVELTASASLGRVPLNLEQVRVADLCKDIEGGPVVRRGAEVTVRADPKLLLRVIRDLWTTANGDPAPESAAIEVLESAAWHEIRVIREGTPISPTVVEALFDPFGANDDATGVTLGLYMARALAVVHGGFLGAEGDDHRTVLLARLPRDSASDPGLPVSGADDDDKGGTS
jgi:signal transduction histidine kinase